MRSRRAWLTHVGVDRDDPQAVCAAHHIRRVIRTSLGDRSVGKPLLVLPQRRKVIVVPERVRA